MLIDAVQLHPIVSIKLKRNFCAKFDLLNCKSKIFLRMVQVNLKASQVGSSTCVRVHRIFLGGM